MKRRLIYFSLIGLLGMGSCSDDFLELSPETDITSASFYKTASHFEQAIVASYNGMRSIALNGIIMDEMRSDNTFFTLYSGDRGPYLTTEVIAEFLNDENTTLWPVNRYNGVYTNIARLNTILGRIDASEMTDTEKAKVRAEALFLRGYYYFDLVQHWGPVPLMLQEVTTESQAFQSNSTVEAIYDQIIEDVTTAIDLGALIAPETFPQSGRATLGAAKMLLAYAYMTKPTREYAKAEAALLDITKMHYGLLDNYADVFDPANKNHKESIFEVQYHEGEGGQNSDFCWRMVPKIANLDFLMGVGGSNTAGTSGGWCVPTQEMIDSYEDGDVRLNGSISVIEGSLSSEILTATAVVEADNYVPRDGVDYFYFINKYYHPPYSSTANTDDNFPVYRYSGALLLLAECLVEEGKADDALPYLNEVRRRAGLGNLGEATAENVANEMRHELAFENHRYTDLIRTGKAIEVLTAHGENMKALYPWLLPSAFNITKEKLIFPFYYRELNVNSNLEQNSGY